MAFTIGQYRIEGNLILAPMAGVTDAPFRHICRLFGADYAVGEMLASAPQLRESRKSLSRLGFYENEAPRAVQLLGADPKTLVEALDWASRSGAQIVDFNMGCPAKKVCNVACGSSLMRDEALAGEIIQALGTAAAERQIPVTLKCRTGWDGEHKNAVRIAKMAEDAGFSLVTVHGRTRAQGFEGEAEYDTIAEVARAVSIPVVANGDIDSANRVQAVLRYTNASAVMIGRAALGRPWIFKEIKERLKGNTSFELSRPEKARLILTHRRWHLAHYGELCGTLTFRKHLLWYLDGWPGFEAVRAALCAASNAQDQESRLVAYFQAQGWM